MKRHIAIAALLIIIFATFGARAQVVSSPKNPNQIAILHWYKANLTIQFPVGSAPELGIAFDGANVWIANYVGGNVTKLRASDGAHLGTFTVGTHPIGLSFDGANIWVSNLGSVRSVGTTVSKLRASEGTLLGTFSAGPRPWGLAFDGANLWVANNGNVE